MKIFKEYRGKLRREIKYNNSKKENSNCSGKMGNN